MKKKIKELSGEYKFNFFLRMGLQLYLEICILCLLNIRYFKIGNRYQFFSLVLSTIFLCAWLWFIVWSMWFGCFKFKDYHKKPRIDLPEYQSMFGEYKTDNLPCVLFNSYFMIRRLLYAWIIVFLPSSPILQVFWFIMICIPIFCLHVVMKPYLSQLNNVMMIINELNLIILGSVFYAFVEPKKDQKITDLLGMICIILVVSNILLNMIVLFILKFKQVYLVRKNMISYKINI